MFRNSKYSNDQDDYSDDERRDNRRNRSRSRSHKKRYDDKYDDRGYDNDNSDSLDPLSDDDDYNDNEEDIHLNRIYINKVRVPSNVLIVGPKRSGKSTMIKHILSNIKDSISTDACIITSDPREYKPMRLSDNWQVISSYDHDLNMREIQDYPVRIIEDWSLRDNKLFEIFRDRRSLNVIAVDRYTNLSSSIRQTIDYVILLGNIKELREIWFDFAGIVPRYSDFRLIYDDCTKGYDFLVIDNFGSSRNIVDHVKWGRINIDDLHDIMYPSSDKIRKRKKTPYRNTSMSEIVKDKTNPIPREETPPQPIQSPMQQPSQQPLLRPSMTVQTPAPTPSVESNTQSTPLTQPTTPTQLGGEPRQSVKFNESNIDGQNLAVRDITNEIKQSLVLSKPNNMEGTTNDRDIRTYSIRDVKPQKAHTIVYQNNDDYKQSYASDEIKDNTSVSDNRTFMNQTFTQTNTPTPTPTQQTDENVKEKSPEEIVAQNDTQSQQAEECIIL